MGVSSGTPANFAEAGLWSTWRHEEKILRTCAIITTSASRVVGPLHDRMPVILPPEHWDVWLDRNENDLALLSSLLRRHPTSCSRSARSAPR